MFVGIVGTMIRPGTFSVAFLESCLSKSEENECLTSVNMKRNQKTLFFRSDLLRHSVCTKISGKYFP